MNELSLGMTERSVFAVPKGCEACVFARPEGPFCPRNTAIGAMLAIKNALDGSVEHTSEEAGILLSQLPMLEELAEECATGIERGDTPIELRADADGVSLHILQNRS